MAGHESQPDPTACRDVLAPTTKIDDVTQESGTRLPKGFLAHERLRFEFTDAELCLDLLADYPRFDVDIDWDNLYDDLIPGQNVVAPEAPQDFNDLNDGGPAEPLLDKTLGVSATQPEDRSSPSSPDQTHGEAPAEQSLDRTLSVSATKSENYASPYFPNTHYESSPRQTQFTSAQEPKSVFQDNTVDPANLLAPAVVNSSDFFGTCDFCGGHDLNGFLPGHFELPDNPSGLEFLQNLHLIGREPQPAMSLVGSSQPSPTNERLAVLTNLRRRSIQRQPDRSRIQRNKLYIENSAYMPLDQVPEKWDIFHYTRDGELHPSMLFSAEEVNRFLFTHPLHQGHGNLKESQLMLRVHKTPASSAKRFPNKLRCRFRDCPMRTINQGQLLVIIDELSVQYPDHDLFLNAAYFHLWCMERHCNFPEICAKLNVSAKGRAARKEVGGKNRFCLALSEEERVVEDFVEACCANGRRGEGGNPFVAHIPDPQTHGCPHYDQPSVLYKGTLCHQLAITKLYYGGQGRINLRKDREDRAGYGGANITRHLGDLSKEAELREYSRSHKNQNKLKPNPKTGRYYRADGGEVKEEQSDYSHIEPSRPQTHQLPAMASPYQTRDMKRNRDEIDNDQTLEHEVAQAHKKPRLGPDLKISSWNSDQSSKVESGNETPQDGQPNSSNRRQSTTLEDESEGEIKLELLATQTRRRALEIEYVKATEDALELRLKRINKKKRVREEGDDGGYESGSRGKRQRVWSLQSA